MSRSSRRRLGGIVIATTAGAIAATAIVATHQPRDQAAELRRALRDSAPTIRVYERPVVLWETFRGRTTLRRGQSMKLGAGTDAGVVSAVLLAPGQRVTAGSVVATIEGAPVVVLPGRLPAYRDLRPRMSGPDVSQLHQAMRSIGVTCACGNTLARADIRALRRLVFSRTPVPLDQQSWKDEVPASGIIWMRALPTIADKVSWREGSTAKTSLASTRHAAGVVSVRSVPAESRISSGQAARVVDSAGRDWSTRVGAVISKPGGPRSFRLGGAPPRKLAGTLSIRVRTVSRQGRALLVPAVAVGTSASGEDRVVVLRTGKWVVRRVRVVADLGGTLAIRGGGLRDIEDVVLPRGES